MAYTNTYVAVGNKEDLSDIIKNISPTDTPLYSAFGSTKATATNHEWIEESLADPTANAAVEGADITASAGSARSRKGNYTQIFIKAYGVSGTQEAVLKAGIKSEIARRMANAMKEIANDVEYAYVNNTAKVAGNASTARQLGGVDALVTTNVLANGGTARALTEALFNDAVEAAWSKGGKPDLAVCSGKNKRNISTKFAGVPTLTTNIDASKKTIAAGIDVYLSDFGTIKIVASTKMPNSKIFVLQSDLFNTAYLRRFAKKDLPVAGDRIEQAIVGELTLECLAERGCAILKDLNGSVA